MNYKPKYSCLLPISNPNIDWKLYRIIHVRGALNLRGAPQYQIIRAGPWAYGPWRLIPIGVVRLSGTDQELYGRLPGPKASAESGRCQRALEKGRGFQRAPVARKAADDLDPERQARRIE